MGLAEKKVVQTELEVRGEYEILRRVVEKRGLTIKQGLREAIRQWIAMQTSLQEDPLCRVRPVKTGWKRTPPILTEPSTVKAQNENILGHIGLDSLL